MAAVHWLKIEGGQPYRGAFRRPKDWADDGTLMTEFRDRRGARVMERVPALGADGTDIRNMRPIRGVKRFVDYLRDDGHIVPVVMTNAAAHVPDEDTSYQQDRRLKARHFGWIEWPHRCPCMLVANGELRPEQMLSRSSKGPALTDEEKRSEAAAAQAWKGNAILPARDWWGKPCTPGSFGGERGPCIHILAERAERRRIRKLETSEREERYKSADAIASEKQTAALENLASKQAQLTERLADMAERGAVKK